jgi:hypothetical protein
MDVSEVFARASQYRWSSTRAILFRVCDAVHVTRHAARVFIVVATWITTYDGINHEFARMTLIRDCFSDLYDS